MIIQKIGITYVFVGKMHMLNITLFILANICMNDIFNVSLIYSEYNHVCKGILMFVQHYSPHPLLVLIMLCLELSLFV